MFTSNDFSWHEFHRKVSKAADQSIAFPWKPYVDRGEDQGKHPRRPWPRRTVVVRPVDKFDKWENYGKLLGWGVFISQFSWNNIKFYCQNGGMNFPPKFFGVKMKQTNITFWWIYTSWNPITEDEHGLRWLVEYQRLDMIWQDQLLFCRESAVQKKPTESSFLNDSSTHSWRVLKCFTDAEALSACCYHI